MSQRTTCFITQSHSAAPRDNELAASKYPCLSSRGVPTPAQLSGIFLQVFDSLLRAKSQPWSWPSTTMADTEMPHEVMASCMSSKGRETQVRRFVASGGAANLLSLDVNNTRLLWLLRGPEPPRTTNPNV